jgi:hypothetical protein
VEEAALSQMRLLYGVGRGLGQFWRVVEWSPTELGSASEVVRIECVEFTETQIVTETRGVYFDTRAVDGTPRARHPVVAWSAPDGPLILPYELGWLHFDRVFDNAAGAAGSELDQTVMFGGPGAKASVYVYRRQDDGSQAAASAEFDRVVDSVMRVGDAEDPWGVFEVGPFSVKYLLSGPDMTVVALAVVGG